MQSSRLPTNLALNKSAENFVCRKVDFLITWHTNTVFTALAKAIGQRERQKDHYFSKSKLQENGSPQQN